MTLVKGIVRVLFLLLMQSAIWSLCVCKPIKKEEFSQLDEDLFGPYFSQKPFWRTSRPPFVLPTWRPPLVWPTLDPYPYWTYRPIDLYDKRNTYASEIPTGLRIFIFILIGIVGLIALICKYIVCKQDESSRESTAVLHPPPARISPTSLDRNSPQIQYRVMPTYARSSTSLSSLRTQLFGNGTVPTDTGTSNTYNAGGSTSLNRNSSQIQHGVMPTYARASTSTNSLRTQLFENGTVPIDTGTSSTYNVSDKPPSYSDVVTSDLIGSTSKFPDVSVTAPLESPPPKYEKGDLPKF